MAYFFQKNLDVTPVDKGLSTIARKEVPMLVLSRKKDETIILKGPNMEDIRITVVRIDNRNKVRIGIEAVKDITVLRSELTEPTEILDSERAAISAAS
jgi:carbon storage regulator CsrA